MTINTSDIKLLESERMTDTANGGGRRTSRVIVDGEPGNIFPKVSRLDSVYGRVNLRKIYGAVVTENLDTYAGAHAVIMDAPDDQKIHNNLFSTGSDYDTRTAARDRIESYVVAGPESRMVLYGRQLVGQQAVLIYQRLEEPLPEVGEVYCLSKETGSVTNYQQFVRVTDISSEVRTFTDESGDFQRLLVTLEIGAPLRYEFKGPETPRRVSSVARDALVRNTTVADAARYYGIRPLAEAAEEDALTVRVDSVYSPIVPTTQRESPISLASIGGAGGYVVTSQTDYADGVGTLPTGVHYFKTAVKPGAVSVVRAGVIWSEDDGAGNMIATAEGGSGWNGTIDYESGRVQVSATFVSDFVTFGATPAAPVSQPARTKEIEITLGNRGTVYSEVLNPPPNPGSLIVDYRALGKWYRLRDDGTGAVGGNDPAHGTGTVDYVTGALVITLGALPDVDSSVINSWGSTVDYVIRAGDTSDVAAGLKQTFTLTELPVQPGTLELSFTNGATAYTATANSSGVISGNGVTGSVNHATGVVDITYTTRLPNTGSTVTAEYNQLVASDPGNPINVTGEIDWLAPDDLTPAPILQGTFSAAMELDFQYPENSAGDVSGTVYVTDDGAGLLVVKAGQILGRNAWGHTVVVLSDATVGTINYTSGEISIPDVTAIVSISFRRYVEAGWPDALGFADITATPGAYVYVQSGGDPVQTARTDEFDTTDAPLIVDLTSTTADAVVPGSVLFTINGASQTFFDRNGTIYTDLDTQTGAALACGSINYDTGRVSLTGQWPEGASTITIAVQCCLTVYGDFSAVDAFFRTAGSPLRPASFYVQGSALDGTLISGTADANGVITGPKVRGEVVQDMGVVRVEFGEEVASVWEPIEIAPSTLRYSAVVLSNLPLNADILGLDPVRLPSDGRVPIYRPADVVVIHHTDGFTLPNPAVAGSTYSVGRADLAELWLFDADGDKVPTTKYTVNLAAGSVTMAADLDLTGYTQPLTARHRIEEMQLLSDVQINGTLGLTAALSREFPMGSLVSSALLFGDLQASVPVLFDLATFTTWSDTPGTGATAQYNDVDYPIEVLNNGAQTDRWRISFTTGNPSSGTASFQVISENLGVIATGNTGSDCAPINLLTGEPYFVIRAAGWGLGWAVGNQLRFNTQAAAAPIWVARTVLPGATLAGDSISISTRGDADA